MAPSGRRGGMGMVNLEDGTSTTRLNPVQVKNSDGTSLTGVVETYAGTHHTVYLKSDGTVWATGKNNAGQLGDGTNTDKSNPIFMMGNIASLSDQPVQSTSTNNSPTNLAPTAPLTIAENQPIGSTVGDFNATDPDTSVTLTYHLVSGVGDGNNSLFTMESNGTLKTATTFDYESNASSYSIRVQVKDEYNATSEQTFTVSITNTNEAPIIADNIADLSVSYLENSGAITISNTWDRTFGGSGEESLVDGLVIPSGGYLFVGSSDSNSTGSKRKTARGY